MHVSNKKDMGKLLAHRESSRRKKQPNDNNKPWDLKTLA